MKERPKFWKASCIGPALLLVGAMSFACGLAASFAGALLRIGPDGKLKSTGDDFWSHVAIMGLAMIGAGLFVMLFQAILWLVRRAGVAQDKEQIKE